MPVIALLIVVLVIIFVGGAYNIGLAKGKELGASEEAIKYKDEINVETKKVVVD